eukprot:6093813-Amphidinium_carterae.1
MALQLINMRKHNPDVSSCVRQCVQQTQSVFPTARTGFKEGATNIVFCTQHLITTFGRIPSTRCSSGTAGVASCAC